MVIAAATLSIVLAAQSPVPPAPPSQDAPPYSVDRVRRTLGTPEAATVADAAIRTVLAERPVFRSGVEVPYMRLETLADRICLPCGPLPETPPVHQEFLMMTTPAQARPYGAFSGGELVQALATSMVTSMAMQGVVALARKVSAGVRQREIRQIRLEIQEELAELERKNQALRQSGGTIEKSPR